LRIGTLRFRTGGAAGQAILSPDGKTVAAASEPGVDLIDLGSGKRLTLRDTYVPDGLGNTSSYLAFAAHGKELVNVTEGYNLRVWDVPTGTLWHHLGTTPEPGKGAGAVRPAPAAGPRQPRWSGVWDAPLSRWLVATRDRRVEYLDPSSGQVEGGFPLRGELTSVSPDGKRLVSVEGERSEAVLYDEL